MNIILAGTLKKGPSVIFSCELRGNLRGSYIFLSSHGVNRNPHEADADLGSCQCFTLHTRRRCSTVIKNMG